MPREKRSRTVAGAWLLSSLLLGLPLLRGAASPEVEVAAATAILLVALLLLPGREGMARLELVLGVVLAWTALQLLPLPPALHAVSPRTAELFTRVLAPLGLYPGPRPLSLNPAATGRALLLGCALALAYGAAWGLGTTRGRRRALYVAIGVSGLLVALVPLVMALFGLGPLLAPAVPFVNPNHLAGSLCLSSFVLLGLALRAHGQERLLWLMAFGVTGLMVFLSLSRGGIAAFLGGAVVFAGLSWRRRRPQDEAGPPVRWVLSWSLGAVLVAAAYLALGPLLAETGTLAAAGGASKLDLWRPALELVADFPLTGVGRGAFADAFTAYKPVLDQVTFTHLENEWLQPLVELGAPVGLLLVGAVAAAWLAAARRRDHGHVEIGALAGLAALAAQNLVDFSLALAGVALPFVVALGLVARGGGAVQVAAARRRGLLALALALGLAGGGAWLARRASAPDARIQTWWSPSDYFVQATEGARLVAADRCAEAMPWLTRAMLLGPSAPEPHLFAARCLAADQQHRLARREYRLAYVFGATGALAEAASRYPSVEALLEVVPDSGDGLLQLGHYLARDRPEEAVEAFRRALEEHLDDRAVLPLARAHLRAGDPDSALALARRRTADQPGDVEGWRLAAHLLLQLDQEEAARALLEDGLRAHPGSPALLGVLAERAVQAGRFSEARSLASQFQPRTPRDLVLRHFVVARSFAGQGRLAEAIEQARAATGLLPEDPETWLVLAGYCEQARRYDEALAAVERVVTLTKAPERYSGRLEALRTARRGQPDGPRLDAPAR